MESQCLDLQLNALKKAGCEKIYFEKISSRKKDRPELQKLLGKLQKGDTVYCYKLDRLGRSLKDLVNLISFFEEKEIRFISLFDGIDTKTSSSKLLVNILMCIADYERSLISQRTKSGLDAARKRGIKLGRPKGMGERVQAAFPRILEMREKGIRIKEIQKVTNISRPTIYKYLKR